MSRAEVEASIADLRGRLEEQQSIERAHRCTCRQPLHLRLYLQRWQCALCLRPVEREAQP